ncbi:MAG: glycerol transporter [Vezdaea aestivalis]|nr:MAG: glycerol transporter [Vezdaea aestivalis]
MTSHLSFFKELYSLDTLDTRFTTSTSTPVLSSPRTGQSRSTQDRPKESEQPKEGSLPKWKTLEFLSYYTLLGIAIPLMFKAAMEVSRVTHPNYPNYEKLLDAGWIPQRKVDNSDAQYSTFRDNIPYLLILLIAHPLLRKVFNKYRPLPRAKFLESVELQSRANGNRTQMTSESRAEDRLSQRKTYDIGFSLVLLTGLHGISVFKILIILYLNFLLATRLPKNKIPLATWIFNIGILFANELASGYQFSILANFIMPWSAESEKSTDNWGSVLDSYGGLVSRWEIMFNITVLRLISFNMDYYWSLNQYGSSPIEKKQLDPSALPERERVSSPASPSAYSLSNYYAYILYSPLYLAGPILTFNDYIYQSRYRVGSITPRRTTFYGIRFLITLLVMELVLHFIYAVAISKSSPVWAIYTPFQLSMLGFFNLHIIWLKLLLPWRFFRLWALVDGIDPPENMVRCMSNNYSALAFWRGWHRSFNRWIVRYIYIPLGGSGRTDVKSGWDKARGVANFLAVFTFVALWHDINLKLLVWGWLITLFVLPEILAMMAFPKKKWENHKNVYRVICGIGAVGNVMLMMAANLVGFAVGLDGLMGLLNGILGSYSGLGFLCIACVVLFVGIQVLFEMREEELRQGIRLKC